MSDYGTTARWAGSGKQAKLTSCCSEYACIVVPAITGRNSHVQNYYTAEHTELIEPRSLSYCCGDACYIYNHEWG